MCAECEAVKSRKEAAAGLLDRLEGKERIGQALKQIYKLSPLEDEWLIMARRFDF